MCSSKYTDMLASMFHVSEFTTLLVQLVISFGHQPTVLEHQDRGREALKSNSFELQTGENKSGKYFQQYR